MPTPLLFEGPEAELRPERLLFVSVRRRGELLEMLVVIPSPLSSDVIDRDFFNCDMMELP